MSKKKYSNKSYSSEALGITLSSTSVSMSEEKKKLQIRDRIYCKLYKASVFSLSWKQAKLSCLNTSIIPCSVTASLYMCWSITMLRACSPTLKWKHTNDVTEPMMSQSKQQMKITPRPLFASIWMVGPFF